MRPVWASDVPVIQGWHVAHGGQAPPTDAFSPMGLIVPDVAAGFIYSTSAPAVALLEGVVTNPAASLRAKSEAIDKILSSLIERAKQRGVRHLVGFASSRGLERRVQKLGWRFVGIYVGVALEI